MPEYSGKVKVKFSYPDNWSIREETNNKIALRTTSVSDGAD